MAFGGTMNLVKRTIAGAGAALLMAGGAQAADIVVGSPNWVTVQVTAHVIKSVLEENLGLEVEVQNGTNPVVFEAMDQGKMHVHPEVWLPNQANLYNTFVEEKGTVVRSDNSVTAFQGMCVPKGTAEALGISKITDLTDPAVAAQFDSNGDGKGEIWIGATGWASTNVEKIRAKSYGYDQTLELTEMDETLALANLDAAVQQSKPFVFFCYTPHHMFGLHDLVVLEEPAHDPDKWIVHQPTDDPNWLENSSAGVAWKDANLHIHYAKALEDSHPDAAAILGKITLSTDQVSNFAFQATVEKMALADVASQFIDANPDLIDAWLR